MATGISFWSGLSVPVVPMTARNPYAARLEAAMTAASSASRRRATFRRLRTGVTSGAVRGALDVSAAYIRRLSAALVGA